MTTVSQKAVAATTRTGTGCLCASVLLAAWWYTSGNTSLTEAEFEFGQLGELERKPYAWGDELKPGVKKNVHRGVSFLCADQYCARYIAGGRGKGELETGTNHVGFRLVRDVDKQKAARS